MNPRSERMHTVHLEFTETESLAADDKANALAAIAVCYNGPPDCPGRQLRVNPFDEGNFRKLNREFRAVGVFAGGAKLAIRKYQCRHCEKPHVIAVEVPKS